jgi:DNA-binding NarL/FixJ family response regulator
MKTASEALAKPIGVLIADSGSMSRQLLVSAFRRHSGFRLFSCETDAEQILAVVAENHVDVMLIGSSNTNPSEAMAVIRRAHLSQPNIALVLVLENPDRDTVINTFRSGAQGLFCQSKHPFQLLCKCVQVVHEGQTWISGEHLRFLIDAVTQVPALRAVNSHGLHLLTPREEQVVALAAEGLANREIAQELRLSEHTVKKYLFRIFDKVGVSNRVELVLFAVNHAERRQAEWVPAVSR